MSTDLSLIILEIIDLLRIHTKMCVNAEFLADYSCDLGSFVELLWFVGKLMLFTINSQNCFLHNQQFQNVLSARVVTANPVINTLVQVKPLSCFSFWMIPLAHSFTLSTFTKCDVGVSGSGACFNHDPCQAAQ